MRIYLTLLVAVLCAGGTLAQEAPSASALLGKTQALLQSLDEAQKRQAVMPMDPEVREAWSFFPGEHPGLWFKDMRDTQREAMLEVLRVALGESGYQKAETIRSLEGVLRAAENNESRDLERYALAIFGDPADTGAWGLRWEGHHLSLNWTVVDAKIASSTVQFLGSNPAEVRAGTKVGTRVLAREEDLARELVHALDSEQRKRAIVSDTAPAEILTRIEREAAIQEDTGIAFGALNAQQQGLLEAILHEYASIQPVEVAAARLAKVRAAGMNAVKFAWMGGIERGEGHYYRIQGPTFLIEYDNTQNEANHAHSVWRDFAGDFGRDLLKEHYALHTP